MKEYKENVKKYAPERRTRATRYRLRMGGGRRRWSRRSKNMKEPTRDSLMESIRSMDTEIPMLLPGINVKMDGESDGYPIEAMQIMKFDGENWELEGDVIEASARTDPPGRGAPLPGALRGRRAQPAPARAVAAAERVGVAALGRLEIDHPDARIGVVGRLHRGLAGAEHGEPLGRR